MRVLASKWLEPGDAVAATGSTARGDAWRGSDLDLWVIGRRSGQMVFKAGSIDVTLLLQTPTEAASYLNLCLYEVDSALVVRDHQLIFQKLKAKAHKARTRIRQRIIALTRQDIHQDLRQLWRAQSNWELDFRRAQLAYRYAALRYYLDTGSRVGQLRHFARSWPGARMRHLGRLVFSGWRPSTLNARTRRMLVFGMEEIKAGHLNMVPLAQLGTFRGLLTLVGSKLRAGNAEDAHWLLRRSLVNEFIQPSLLSRGERDLGAVTRHADWGRWSREWQRMNGPLSSVGASERSDAHRDIVEWARLLGL